MIPNTADSPENSVKKAREHRVKRSRERKNESGNGPPAASLQGAQNLPRLRKHGLSNEEKKLTPANIEAVENLKRANASVETIHRLTGWSPGVISKYTSHIEPMFSESLQVEQKGTPQNNNDAGAAKIFEPAGKVKPTIPWQTQGHDNGSDPS